VSSSRAPDPQGGTLAGLVQETSRDDNTREAMIQRKERQKEIADVESKQRSKDDSSHWKMWNMLDMQEEEDRHALAVLFAYLEGQQVSEGSPSLRGKEGSDGLEAVTSNIHEIDAEDHAALSVEVQRDYDGVTLTDPMEPGIGRDLLASFIAGCNLHIKFAKMIIEQALAILNKCDNVTRLKAPCTAKGETITVVGDLHGNIADLDEIFRVNGPPSAQSIYIFNGDFVDRGDEGVEVMLVLLTMKVLHPEHIHLDRGNHEDVSISAAYGFKSEAIRKYGKAMFKMFVKVFCALPLCCIIGEDTPGKSIFVVHGGVTETKKVSIDDLNGIKRHKFASTIAPKPRKKATKEQKMIEDLTWSDPKDTNGYEISDRGSGILYGPDITREFLKGLGCKTIVRSHECIEEGVERTDLGEGYQLFTIFSSSNYSDGDNFGAVLIFDNIEKPPKVIQYRTRKPPPVAQMQNSNQVKLGELICRRHFRLERAFNLKDPQKTGKIPIEDWKEVMSSTLKVEQLEWTNVGLEIPREGDVVDYNTFLKQYTFQTLPHVEQIAMKSEDSAGAARALYSNYDLMQAVFDKWDANHDGQVDKEEFRRAISFLNESHAAETVLDADHLFDLLDLDKSGSINVNEVCESSRLLRASSG